MLRISKAALVAAVLSLSAVSIASLPALAEEKETNRSAAATTSTTGLETTLSIPTINAVDSTMDEAALRDALSGGFMKHVDEFAKLSASSITIPQIIVKMVVTGGDAPGTTTITIRNLLLSNVKNGIAESASVGSMETQSANGSFDAGTLAATNIDFGAILAFYSLVEGDTSDTAMKPLYTSLSFDGGKLTSPAVNCDIGKIKAGTTNARPLKVSYAQMLEASQQLEAAKGGTPPASAIATMIGYFADLLQAYQSDGAEVGNISCKGTSEAGKAFDFGIGNLSIGGLQSGIYPAITLKDLKITADDGAVELGEAVLKPIDFTQPLAVVDASKADFSPMWFETNWRKLIPAFGGFSLSGLKIDVPDSKDSGQRVKANIASFDLALSNYFNGIPTKIATKATGVAFPLPTDGADEGMKNLIALGITDLNLDYELNASWDQATHTVKVDKVSVNGNDLGSFAIAAMIGNVTDQVFDLDPKVMQVALLNLTAQSLKFDVTDLGLGDKLIPMLAQEQGVPVDGFRTKMAGVAEGAALQLLGATDAARALGQAVGAFIGGTAKSLSVTVTAKDPNGIGMPLLMQAQNDPTVLTNAIEITGASQ